MVPPSGIQPFGLKVRLCAADMLTLVRAIAGNWVPEPGVTLVGSWGAGLTAGVLPSACT